jgi:hypothetical protein
MAVGGQVEAWVVSLLRTIEFDFEKDGITKHHSSAMLYLKQGNTYKLGALGACDWEMEK